MGNAYSARQSTFGDGDVITAALFNNEFDQIVQAFNLGSGHTHDGTAGEGGPITSLLGQVLSFGTTGSADDVVISFNTSGNIGQLTWDQSADKFIFADAVKVTGNLEVTGTADFGDSSFTNVGSIALDSITGDEDANTSITFSGSDVITMATGGTTRFVVNSSGVAVTGTSTLTGATTVDGDLTVYHEDSDSDGTVAGPTLTLQRKTSGAHPQVNDKLGQIIFKGEDGGGADTEYIKLLTSIADATGGSEDAKFMIQGIKGGTNKNIALFRSELISFGQRSTNENQPVEFNGPFYGRVGGLSGSRFVHSEQGLNLEGAYTVPIKNSRTIDTITNTSSGTACVVTTDDNHGFSDNMLLYVDNTGISLLDGKSFFIMTVTGQPKQLTLHNAYDGADPQHSGATASSGNIGGLGYGLRIHNTQTDSAHEQDCHIELGGNDDVFIDLKKPNDNDYDLRVAHLNNDTSVVTSKTGNLILKTETNGSSVLLQHEGANTKLQTTDTGVDVTGTITADGLTMLDSEKITLGTGGDLEIYHNGNHSYILEAGTGDLRIGADELKIVNSNNNETKAVFATNGSVELYNDHSKKFETTDTGIDVTGEVKGDSLDIDGNAALTGTVTIDPPLVTSAPQGLGAKGVIMKQGDLRMKVDGNYDGTNAADVLGGSLQNNSRIIFDSEQHEHIQYEGKGYQKPAFVIQANYDASNTTYGSAGTDAQAYLDANISQLGNGNLNISSGKLQLRGKISTDTSTDDGQVAGDGYLEHESYMAITIDGDATNGTVTRLHFGKADAHNKNIRLQPSASGIIVEGMGTAGSPTTTLSNSGTIGTFNDEDLLTLANESLTVAGVATLTSGELTNNLVIESTSSNTSGAPDIVLKRTKANNADNADDDVVGNFQYNGKTDNGTEVTWAATRGVIKDATNASYEGQFEIRVPKAGVTAYKQVVVQPDLIKLQKPVEVTGKITATASGIADNDVAVYGSGVADDDFLRINGTDVEGLSASEVKTALSLAKADVGLGNVDNESKATMFSSPTFTGTVTAPALTASLTVAVESASKNATEMTALIGKRIIHTGTAETYTMPDVVANDAGKTWTIMNNGTGSLTINRTTNTEFFELVAGQTSSAATSITLVKGGAAEFIVQAANKIVVVGSGI